MSRGDHRRKLTLAEYGFRLPSRDRQPAAALQRMGGDAPADHLCLGDAGRVGDGADRRRLCRAGDPPDRADRSADRDQAGRGAGPGPDRRGAQDRGSGLSHAGDDAHQADGRGSDRVHARGGAQGPLHAFGRRDAGAHRADPRPAARRVRRARRHQPAARRARHSRMRAGRDPRRRQGRLPALRNLADPDDRPRRAQRRRAGDPLCRSHHRHRWSARCTRPSGGARSSSPTTTSMASRRRRSAATSATSSRTSPAAIR